MKGLLEDPAYRRLSKDPVGQVEQLLLLLLKKYGLSEIIWRLLKPRFFQPPLLCGLLKIHKSSVPLRPIVNTVGAPTYEVAKYLTGPLSSLVGQCMHHVKNWKEFIKFWGTLQLSPADLLVMWFLLYTQIPIQEPFELLKPVFTEEIVNLFQFVVTSLYFLYDGAFYEQVDGVAMGSPLSPVVANFYMEAFEHLALEHALLKPSVFKCYIDDTFVVWPHGIGELEQFGAFLNSIHPNVAFTMEMESQGRLSPFLDAFI